MQTMINQIQWDEVGDVSQDVYLSEHTTWKIGGKVDLFLVPHNMKQLQKAITILHKNSIPWIQIGRGSNVLVSDKGVRGAVIKLGSEFEHITFGENTVHVGAAYSFIKLSVMAAKQGYTGLEFAGGIPGSVGGAVCMNAGALGSDVSRVLLQANIVSETGDIVQMNANDFKFNYRYSILQGKNSIVTDATFALKKGNRDEIMKQMNGNKERRLQTQPLQLPSGGSVFRNPENNYAAKLIEEAGLKGLRSGDAEISQKHANFIVNHGDAKAEDVLSLIQHIQNVVREKFGIELVREVLFIGES
ncbi:UDP-N-acetylmuramate dehydrogenase [Longirhabdus pacifica]|uniref:UDP-N-acetylmuramate dehydrogenase n=1 Tax=Longirhabdus pacifica TaxID=2305227 RepID=UPI0010090DAA|nr:UDP-N-acetylmuramate dehydrogenase [Longirhabdus pacifica]